MPAVVTIILESDKEDIRMNLDPDDYLEDVLERCLDYWLIDEDKDNFRFVKGEEVLKNENKVIDSEIQKNDVLKLMNIKKIDRNLSDAGEVIDNRLDLNQQIENSKNWLSRNIGISKEKIQLVDKKSGKNHNHFLFRVKDEYFTMKTNGREVTKYIPGRLDLFREE